MPRTLLVFVLACTPVAPLSQSRAAEPAGPPAEISQHVDALLQQLWKQNRAKPAKAADDATFLRRVYLDLTGTIPNVNATRRFLQDPRPDKRQRLIEKLMGTAEQSAHLSRELAKAMLPSQRNLRPQFENWLFQRLQAGATWDQIATDIVAPTGNDRAGEVLFANSLERKPQKVADATARVFLGLQMGCAECHDHPFGQWTREEFWNYSAFFADAVVGQDRVFIGQNVLKAEPKRRPIALKIPETNTIARPQFPGAKEPLKKNETPNRKRLAMWLVASENPWFAKAAVNRVWSTMFGRGLVEPVDDLTRMEDALARDVLNLLAADFATHGFDLKRLLEIIAGTQAYQLASHTEGNETVHRDLFHVMSVRSLTAEQIYDCLIQAVSDHRPIAGRQQFAAMEKRPFISSLTAPTQSATEFQAGIPQMLTMLNGPLIARVTDVQKCDLLAGLNDGPFFDDDDRIEILYLATVTRHPTEAEHRRARDFLKRRRQANSHGQELGDLLWALLNSSEFLLNH